MIYFRLIENIKERTPLGYGTGPARWNLSGIPMIYACNHAALNYLEILSIKGAIVSESEWRLVTLEINEEIPRIDPESLPENWKNRPYPRSTQHVGSQWANNKKSVCLMVPSCRISLSLFPQEHNLLINPLHEDFTKTVKVIQSEIILFEINKE